MQVRFIRVSCCVSLGKVGAWSSHVPQEGPADLRCAIQSMAVIGEVCGATASWPGARIRLVWYAANSTNLKLARRFGDQLFEWTGARRHGLSNPMKSFFGIERLKLKGRRVEAATSSRVRCPGSPISGPTTISAPSSSARTRVAASSCSLPTAPIPRSPSAVQAVPRHGRHGHLWRAVPRRVRAG